MNQHEIIQHIRNSPSDEEARKWINIYYKQLLESKWIDIGDNYKNLQLHD